MKLNSLRLKNLRSLADTGTINLRPLTLLVGTNSSGKSTFLRSLPLLRQSVETLTAGPILWYGRYVDFGSFSQALRHGANSEGLTFEFGLTIGNGRHFDEMPILLNNDNDMYLRHFMSAVFLEKTDFTITLVLGKGNGEGNVFAEKIELRFFDNTATIYADEKGNVTKIKINEYDAPISECQLLRLRPSANILPLLEISADSNIGTKLGSKRIPGSWRRPFEVYLQEAFKPLFNSKTSISRISEIAHSIGIGSPENQLKQLQKLNGGAIYKTKANKLTINSLAFIAIKNATIGNRLLTLFRIISNSLATIFRPICYIAPVRATAERYYRQQDLSVAEVDPQGANLAMFLQSLTESEKLAFSNWCKEKFSFFVHTKTEGAHTSLLLKNSNTNDEYNIADMGFGFSQMLPILAQIWTITREKKDTTKSPEANVLPWNRKTKHETGNIIAIEQPELHLHPRLQARVADMLATTTSLSNGTGRPLTIVCETHSETIVNRVGYLIASGKLSKSEVQIIIFDKSQDESVTKITQATYNNDGVLENWPYGFFLSNGE